MLFERFCPTKIFEKEVNQIEAKESTKTFCYKRQFSTLQNGQLNKHMLHLDRVFS